MEDMTKEEKAEMLEDLKLEATSLGIEYNQRIGYDKLKDKVDEHYDNESKANSVPVEVKEEPKEDTKEQKPGKVDPRQEALMVIKKQQAEGKKTQVVKITMVDKREASTALAAYFNDGNQAMRVPLDTYVEMPKYLIDQAENARAVTHMETPNGGVSKYTKKYVVEYKK